MRGFLRAWAREAAFLGTMAVVVGAAVSLGLSHRGAFVIAAIASVWWTFREER